MGNAKRPTSINLLFIGNSFTQRNNLPGLLADMASQRGLTLKHELISAGGASLRTHWNAGHAQTAIESGSFDYVVLQEQSTLPVKNASRMAENIRLFDEVIKRSGAKTVLYMTWPRRHSPEHQKPIADAYTSIGNEMRATVIPVGVVWHKFRTKHKSPILYDPDQSHPTLAGSYLAACVFLAVLFNENAEGVHALSAALSKEDAGVIQKFVRKQFAKSK
jgi:hypothetical protein